MQNRYTLLILLFCILFLGNAAPLYAYAPFKPGYYVQTAQDTVWGLVKLTSREDSEKRCSFKASQSADEQFFKADEILAYGLTASKIFRSRKVNDTTDLQVFMELLQSGRVNLYRYTDRFFLEYDQNQKFAELKSSVLTYNQGYRVYKETKHEYADILKEAMADCPNVAYPISSGRRRLLIRERDLMKVVEDYHNCFKERAKRPDPREISELRVGFMVGFNISRLDFSPRAPFTELNEFDDNSIYSVVNTDYEVSAAPAFGFSMDIDFPRNRSGIGFRGEFLYYPTRFNGSNEFFIPFNTQSNISDELEIRLHRISFPLGLKKRLGKETSPFYAILGIAPQFNVGRNFVIFRESEPVNNTRGFSTINNVWSTNDFELAFWGKFGVTMWGGQGNEKLNFELRLEHASRNDNLFGGFASVSNNRYQTQSLSAMFNYLF
ncbi:MAG: outer membrane beta-barrel protein [Bacteroidota bacterium]